MMVVRRSDPVRQVASIVLLPVQIPVQIPVTSIVLRPCRQHRTAALRLCCWHRTATSQLCCWHRTATSRLRCWHRTATSRLRRWHRTATTRLSRWHRAATPTPSLAPYCYCTTSRWHRTATRLDLDQTHYQTRPRYVDTRLDLPDQTRLDQTRPDQTRPDQTRPDQTRPDQTTRPRHQTRPRLASTVLLPRPTIPRLPRRSTFFSSFLPSCPQRGGTVTRLPFYALRRARSQFSFYLSKLRPQNQLADIRISASGYR